MKRYLCQITNPSTTIVFGPFSRKKEAKSVSFSKAHEVDKKILVVK